LKPLVPLVCVLLFTGCDKLPKPEVALDPAPVPAAPPPPSAPSKSPQQILDEFLRMDRRLLRDEHLQQVVEAGAPLDGVTSLDLRGCAVTNAGTSHLSAFTALAELDLSNCRIDGAALPHVGKLSRLRVLELDGLLIEDSSLAATSALTELEELTLNGTSISDSAFEHLKDLPRLRVLRAGGNRNLRGVTFSALVKADHFRDLVELSVEDTAFGYYGLREIGRLEALEVLRVGRSDVVDTALEDIHTCTSLRVLNLNDNMLTNNALRRINRLKNLEELRLHGNAGITDEGLTLLRTHTGLRLLSLDHTRVTPGAARLLKERFLKDTTITIEDQKL
jgi:Leucine-rich repeat (LRR) protein